MKVKAAVARVHGAPLTLESLELEEPRAGEILVRLVASGVTATDLDAIDGRLSVPLPFVPGCEAAGIVERVGIDVHDVEAGDAVLVGFDCCGTCASCMNGNEGRCESFKLLNLNGRRADGSSSFVVTPDGAEVSGNFLGQSSFATHLLCRWSNAFKVGNDAPLELLAGLGHDVLRGASAVLRGFDLQPDESLVIFGADAAGLAALMVAKARDARTIVVVDGSEARRARAEALGVTATVHAAAQAADVVRSLVADGATYAFDTTGDAVAREACLVSLADGGRCALTDQNGARAVDLVTKDGVACHAKAAMDRSSLVATLVAMQADGRLPLDQIIAFFPFEHVNDALDALRDDSMAKPALRFSLGSFGDLDRAMQEGAADDLPEPAHEDNSEQISERELDRDKLISS